MKIFVDIFLRGWWGSTKLDNFLFIFFGGGGGGIYIVNIFMVFLKSRKGKRILFVEC